MEDPDKANWLLIKEKDEFARESSAKAITEEAPNSAASGRSLEKSPRQMGRVWNSERRQWKARGGQEPADREKAAAGWSRLPGACAKHLATANSEPDSARAIPGFIAPELAQSTSMAPRGNDWIHELKLDGYRIQIHVRRQEKGSGHAESAVLTRKGLDWTHRMPDIADRGGEAECDERNPGWRGRRFGRSGREQFRRFASRISGGTSEIHYVFCLRSAAS